MTLIWIALAVCVAFLLYAVLCGGDTDDE